MAPYIPRVVDPLLAQMVAEHPVLLIAGPRACGKTTSAMRHARTVVRLDVPGETVAFLADPDAALRTLPDHPVLIDEWQEVPEVLGAVKRAVDGGNRGPYILSGSVRAPLDHGMWPGTGRLVTLAMTGLTRRELVQAPPPDPLPKRLANALDTSAAGDPPDLVGYLEMAIAGGFPEPLTRLTPDGRRRWHAAYVEQVVARDLASNGAAVDVPRLAAYLRAYAAAATGVADHSTIFRVAGLSRTTADRYEALLGALHLVESIPAWSTSRVKRLVLQPKRVMLDGGLWAAVVGVDVPDVLRDGGLLGRLLETFVIAQLRAEVALSPGLGLHHLRMEAGRHEVDLILEIGGGRIIAIEVKATAAPKSDDARHLAWLRDRLGEDLVLGVVLHTGPRAFRLGERIVALPIHALWTA